MNSTEGKDSSLANVYGQRDVPTSRLTIPDPPESVISTEDGVFLPSQWRSPLDAEHRNANVCGALCVKKPQHFA
jgi:hypothetical protein